MLRTFSKTIYIQMLLKASVVVPIHKSGDIANIKNYRPISLCSVVGKMLERVVTRNVVEYMQTSGLISPQQHGFISGRSCTTLLTKVCHHWSQILDERSPPDVDVIFLDWSKAFDKVSHSILLSKLHQYGICGSVWSWISSFLLDRFVSISEELPLDGSRSSQGSLRVLFWGLFCSIFLF